MIAALALSSLIGTWDCTDDLLPGYRVRYTLRSDRTGTLTSSMSPSGRWPSTQTFVYRLTYECLTKQYLAIRKTSGCLIERYPDALLELKLARFRG